MELERERTITDGYLRTPAGSLATPYQMPKITGATVTVWLEGGDYYNPPWGIAHKRGLAPDQSDVQLELMDAPDLLSPLGMATVSQATEYLWNGPDVAYVFNASFNTSVADAYVLPSTSSRARRRRGYPGLPMPRATRFPPASPESGG